MNYNATEQERQGIIEDIKDDLWSWTKENRFICENIKLIQATRIKCGTNTNINTRKERVAQRWLVGPKRGDRNA